VVVEDLVGGVEELVPESRGLRIKKDGMGKSKK